MKSMQVWLVCFLLFLGAAEFYQWIQGISLPMPAFVFAGALLAVASNADKFPLKGSLLSITPRSPDTTAAAPLQPPTPDPVIPSSTHPPAHPPTHPPAYPDSPATRSISFTIRKP
ncbi:hypothetical protein [Egbenema bharatensis]|uniref:hypothetical protein n=1 Tax=Egbenema bharatensis TaxID=3463334 RepID=UPI003A873AF4